MIVNRSAAFAAIAVVLIPAAAAAQVVDFENNGLSGDVSLAGTGKTGNTESTDISLGLKLRHETDRWRQLFGGNYDWGSADEEDTKNRLAATYELARLLTPRLYTFGRTAYEQDQFSGYEYRAVAGGGLGYDVLTHQARRWSLQGGPAYRIDEVEASYDPDTGVLLAPAERQTSVALNLGSRFDALLNDAVTFNNTTDVTSSADTNTFLNSASLTAAIMGPLEARFSFDVLHDTSPPLGAEKTDTTTRAALVYTFGGGE
jgi:putative salt-induced outer membrane protein